MRFRRPRQQTKEEIAVGLDQIEIARLQEAIERESEAEAHYAHARRKAEHSLMLAEIEGRRLREATRNVIANAIARREGAQRDGTR